MRLNSLRLTNFRQHCDTFVTFDTGLTGIIGANGSGKSTLLEAIAWALYGQDAARGKKETLRSLRAGPNARVKVELDFELGGHRYRVERGLTTAELYLDGSDAPIANSLTGVTELLRRRLGMSRDEFFNTYFTGQKELDVMAAMAPSERAQFLSRVLGYERLRTAQRLVRERARLLAAEAAGVRATMPEAGGIERLHADATDRLARANVRARESAERRDRAGAMLADIVPRWLAALPSPAIFLASIAPPIVKVSAIESSEAASRIVPVTTPSTRSGFTSRLTYSPAGIPRSWSSASHSASLACSTSTYSGSRSFSPESALVITRMTSTKTSASRSTARPIARGAGTPSHRGE